ncbi:zf-HC2 domain-containing protein [Myxococcota bacterium]|nr:zf-HC2 domain-containing protein [Myxococcota bacterium]
MAEDREVAGIRCTAVLAHLSDYLDGEVAEETRRTIDAHLVGCDWCARFGGRFAGVVRDLQGRLGASEALDPAIADRLFERLQAK